ncbi:MAG: hypothetical protein ACSHYF_14135 [Verrucomicrobiaceae bacterium]
MLRWCQLKEPLAISEIGEVSQGGCRNLSGIKQDPDHLITNYESQLLPSDLLQLGAISPLIEGLAEVVGMRHLAANQSDEITPIFLHPLPAGESITHKLWWLFRIGRRSATSGPEGDSSNHGLCLIQGAAGLSGYFQEFPKRRGLLADRSLEFTYPDIDRAPEGFPYEWG